MAFAVTIFSEGFGTYYVCADGLATRVAIAMVFQVNVKVQLAILTIFWDSEEVGSNYVLI